MLVCWLPYLLAYIVTLYCTLRRLLDYIAEVGHSDANIEWSSGEDCDCEVWHSERFRTFADFITSWTVWTFQTVTTVDRPDLSSCWTSLKAIKPGSVCRLSYSCCLLSVFCFFCRQGHCECVWLFSVFRNIFLLVVPVRLSATSASNWLERLISEIAHDVFIDGSVKSCSLTHTLAHSWIKRAINPCCCPRGNFVPLSLSLEKLRLRYVVG